MCGQDRTPERRQFHERQRRVSIRRGARLIVLSCALESCGFAGTRIGVTLALLKARSGRPAVVGRTPVRSFGGRHVVRRSP